MNVHRRTVLTGMLGASALVAAPAILRAQGAPMKIGFLTVKTGPLASGGIQMEQGLTLYLKERNNVLAGRPVQLFTGDSGGAPAVARTKMQEFVEKENIACLIGPLATAEALAIDDYIRDKQVPTLSVAAAEDMTQRKANPWFVRATSSSAQCSYAMGDYAAKELGYKRAAMIADDLAYGHELNAGFQRAFEDAGGKVVQKLWPPLNAPDYGTYIAQIKRTSMCIFIGFAGSNGFKFLKQYKEYGGNIPILGGMTAIDESLLQQMGDEATRLISTCLYSAQIDSPTNKKFVEGMNARLQGRSRHLRRRHLHQRRGAGGRAEEDRRQDRGQERADEGAARSDKVEDTARGPVQLRQIRQRDRQRLHPQGREEGRQAGQHRDQDLSQCEPVLDLRSRGIPEAPRLQSRDVARKQESRTVRRKPIAAPCQRAEQRHPIESKTSQREKRHDRQSPYRHQGSARRGRRHAGAQGACRRRRKRLRSVSDS